MPRLPLLAALLCLPPSVALAAGPLPDPLSEESVAAFWAALTTQPPPRPRTGEVEFIRSFTDRYGVPCQEYRQQVLIDDELVTATGTVCRGFDGSWVMVRD
jgi:hypothetical protein